MPDQHPAPYTAPTPTFSPGFDRELFLAELYSYLLSTRAIAAKLRASGLADSAHSPFGALRMQVGYLAPVLLVRCDELTELLIERTRRAAHASNTTDPAITEAVRGNDA